MNIVLIVPTGIGAKIGGHVGDANPICKMLAGLSDTLITHPNVVNGSDINEMPHNVWYVEGSILDRFLIGDISLEQPLQNKILLVANRPIKSDTVNAVNAARVTIGASVEIMELNTPLKMIGNFRDGIASGEVSGWKELAEQVEHVNFDALAIHTPIDVPREVALNYYRHGGVNPWGGVEAIASKLIASALNKPVAHAPLDNTPIQDKELLEIVNEIVDPRIAPEIISNCYLHCVLKGLNRAPRISDRGLSVHDINVMVSPSKCHGRPHKACLSKGIPVIVVRENSTICNDHAHPNFIYVENYWEAAGIISCMKAEVTKESVRYKGEY